MLLAREEENCFDLFTKHLIYNDKKYRNYMRMTLDDFEFILHLVTPIIRRQDTVMRRSVQPHTRLALTLRYLGTGEEYSSLEYQFRVGSSTILK